jgi:hypothetical protein
MPNHHRKVHFSASPPLLLMNVGELVYCIKIAFFQNFNTRFLAVFVVQG